MASSKFANVEQVAQDFLTFINASPSQFHATAYLAQRLDDAGFTRIKESDDWRPIVQPDTGYYYTRNQSSLVAFVTPPSYSFTNINPFLILAAHTDSPVLKVKPVSRVAKHGYQQVGVECYGGGLWNTWFDRDLSVAGRVIVKDGGNFATKLVTIDAPILRIPNLAIHLNREVNDKGFIFNKQTHLLPMLATSAKTALNADAKTTDANNGPHHSILMERLASALSVAPESIVDLELSLFDTQKAVLGGINNEFIFSRALDNLMMSFVSTRALIQHYHQRKSSSDGGVDSVRMVALFDNEEVGSESWQGAGASLRSTLARLHTDSNTLPAAIRRSLLVSADMAHAVHPNYAESHEENHRPALHGGLVIKQNANQRYATSSLTSLSLTQLALDNGIPVQKFVVRNDSACGSTIGPILSANTGIRTVDVGVPQLSMHSIREMCGVDDVESATRLFQLLLQQYEQLEKRTLVDGE